MTNKHLCLSICIFAKSFNTVMWMTRALLGNGPVNISLPNTHKARIQESFNATASKLPSVQYTTTVGIKNERCFLWCPCEAYIRVSVVV
jgi:hypothetical protein